MIEFSFREFLTERIAAGGFSTEDALTTLLPLFRETLESHSAELVAPLEGLDNLGIIDSRAWFMESARVPIRNSHATLRTAQELTQSTFDIVGTFQTEVSVENGARETKDQSVGDIDHEVTRPIFLPGYISWEHKLEHHDPVTDIFSLGMLMASLVCGLDFRNGDDLVRFVENRKNLFAIAPNLHPVVARIIVQMTELYRHSRAQDLRAIIRTLENYRDQEPDLEFELARLQEFSHPDVRSMQSAVLTRLRERLFNISRRNRLLNFRPTLRSVNLTQASIPLSFDLKSIREDQVMVWDETLHQKICSGKPLSLNAYLNFAEALYLPGTLNRMIAEARRDAAEYGMAQLRLAICFLSWTNLKEQPFIQYESPLLLLAVQLKKKKGISDKYMLEIVDSVAEINPVVRHQFKQLYAIELPLSIDLEKTDVHQFYNFLAAHINASQSGVTLKKIDKPRINIIHEKAKRRLDQYRRRAKVSGRGVRQFMDLDYSYDPVNFHPLGVKIFANYVQPNRLRLKEIVEDTPQPRRHIANESDGEKVAETKRTIVPMERGTENPYVWHFDLCNVTLANFKYRKMSLIRDFESLLEDQPKNEAFESVFSLALRPQSIGPIATPELTERFDVVPCDPTQAGSIAKARDGQSYIIQGPPGTGKSQTISNLIADYVSQGKRVLFVCEKRAAIDVVYSRLKQLGLGTLCCLIHDSQTDKKSFVMDLKQSYEQFLDFKIKSRRSSRQNILNALSESVAILERLQTQMSATSPKTGLTIRELLARCLELGKYRPDVEPIDLERLPDYSQWLANLETLSELHDLIHELQPDGVLARHALSLLSPNVANAEYPMALVAENVASAQESLAAAIDDLRKSQIDESHWNSLERAGQLGEFASRLAPYSAHNALELLSPDSQLSKSLDKSLKQLDEYQSTFETQKKATATWHTKLSETDVTLALEQAEGFRGKFFSWLSPTWWRLRSTLNRSYDFKSHAVRPGWITVLKTLQDEFLAARHLEDLKSSIAQQFHFSNELDEGLKHLNNERVWLANCPRHLQETFNWLITAIDHRSTLDSVVTAQTSITRLIESLGKITDEFQELDWSQLTDVLDQINGSLDEVPEYHPCLLRLAVLPKDLQNAIRKHPWTLVELEAAVAHKTYEEHLQNNRWLNAFDHVAFRSEASKLKQCYEDWLDSNATEILSRQREKFLSHVQLCEQQNSQLTTEQKEFKKRYKKGRRELEHEFGKTMRYKPIRNLMADESAEVINDLKPVWLMSPLSVSDALPLDDSLVDVVIFDEASQVTLEESIPTIFRAQQTIIVGDEMQLPPTNFFSSNSPVDDDELEFEEEGELVQYDLNTDSLLSHSARNLPSTMLGWHYRSRSESLISFSNRAFYGGRLLTIPEENLPVQSPQHQSPSTALNEVMEAMQFDAQHVLQRPISFHFIEPSLYDQRRNTPEAEHIAKLVKKLLEHNDQSEEPKSIGIVAFSEAQQDEIEQAIDRLGREDPEFQTRIEIEYEREIDNQFVGLLVKNLENIQGDERDIIILSVCYGPNPTGRILMNFGPINRMGGEKRLNVAFSRAKHHMCVVSSMRGADITNDYNDGARCLKDYLSYAESVSTGNQQAMEAILNNLTRIDSEEDRASVLPPLNTQIANALESRGYRVDHGIGQSEFRCDLGVYRTDDPEYRLGILVDSPSYYALDDVLERDVMRPHLLAVFGWNVTFVMAKDWYSDSDAVLKRILDLIG